MQFDELSRRLKGIEEASIKGSPIRKLYRLIFMPEIWQEAYARIYANKGVITKGINNNTLDGFSMKRVENILQVIRKAKYRFKPVRRVYIPKRTGNKKRPIGIPTGDDKLIQEVARILLERIYEPIFSDKSHGFRPNRSCHTALEQIRKTWKGVKWFIEIDIKGFFDNMDHEIMDKLLAKKIEDKCLINLIQGMLRAGYLENWRYHQTYSGTPQGGIISPVLSNIYLHELDIFMESLTEEFSAGKRRPENPEYKKLGKRRNYLRTKIRKEGKTPELMNEFREIGKTMRNLPSKETHSDHFKRLRYCRYADDFVIGITGTKEDAKEIMQEVVTFLNESLKLQVAEGKSSIKSAKEGITFLSYHIHTWRTDKVVKTKIRGTHTTIRTVAEHISLQVPEIKVMQFCQKYGYGIWNTREHCHRPELLRRSDMEIIMTYNAELMGITNYYCLADDVKRKLGKLQYIANYSLLKTLANKHKTKKSEILKRLKQGKELIYRYEVKGEVKELRVFKLKHMTRKVNNWEADEIPNTLCLASPRSEIVKRLEARECEYCGRSDLPIESHHVKKLKDLKDKPHLAYWQKVMIARNRKTMIICIECHDLLHAGKLPYSRFDSKGINRKAV